MPPRQVPKAACPSRTSQRPDASRHVHAIATPGSDEAGGEEAGGEETVGEEADGEGLIANGLSTSLRIRMLQRKSICGQKTRGVVVLMALCLWIAAPSAQAQSLFTSESHTEEARQARKKAFQPWDAGPAREVTRQGVTGRKRPAHPFVGDAAKVPGEGPPPPPLARDHDVPETALDQANRIGPSLSSNPLWLASLVYSNFLTRMDGPRCHHYPTCSRFGSQAVAKHKVMGLFLGLDRILQPPVSSAIRGLPTVYIHGGSRSFDPLENYEFWKPEAFTGFPPATEEEPLDGPHDDATAQSDSATPPSPATTETEKGVTN